MFLSPLGPGTYLDVRHLDLHHAEVALQELHACVHDEGGLEVLHQVLDLGLLLQAHPRVVGLRALGARGLSVPHLGAGPAARARAREDSPSNHVEGSPGVGLVDHPVRLAFPALQEVREVASRLDGGGGRRPREGDLGGHHEDGQER